MRHAARIFLFMGALLTGCAADLDGDEGTDGNSEGPPFSEGALEASPFDVSADSLASGTYMFQSGVSTSRCMDVADGSSQDGANIRQWTCNFAGAQKFRVEPISGGVRLVNTGSNKCVDVAGNKLVDFTNVQLYRCNGSGAQRFQLVDVPGGVQIVHRDSGKCVGVADGNPAQGTNIRIRTCGLVPAQTWVPREASGPVRIMPLGASITQGYGGTRAGYRARLSEQLNARGIAHRFVGSVSDNPGPLPVEQRRHEGHPGWVIADGNGDAGLRKHIDTWLGARGADPDIVLLLVGSNDVDRNIDLPRAGARLDDLIGRIRTLKPRALLYVAKVPPISAKATATADYNAQVANVVAKREARGEAVHLVDAHTPLLQRGRMSSDGKHPNDAGYDVIAQLWLQAIIGR